MKSIPPAVVAVAVVAVLAIVVFFGWKSMNPDTSPTHIGADGKHFDPKSNPVLQQTPTKEKAGGASTTDAQ